jgi:hypothetical protein
MVKPIVKGLLNLVQEKKPSKTERDYPDTPLSTRLNHDKQIQFLEDHGYSLLMDDKNKNFTFEIVEDTIKVYTPKAGKLKDSMEQKTFKNPTLKQMRNWMGYKTGGTLMLSNPNPYEPTAI